MQEQKKYHQRKLAIIEMIELCELRVKSEVNFMEKFSNNELSNTNSLKNIARYERIKKYLLIRYKN